MRDAIAAHVRLQTAIDTRNADSIAAVLASEVVAITFHGDTLRGASAVTAHLLDQTRDSATALVLYRGRMEACLEGWVLEFDGRFSALPMQGSVAGSTVGSYAVRWAQWPEGARVVRIVMVAGRSRAPVRMQPCRFEYVATALNRRITAVVSGEFSPVGARPALRDVSTEMVSRGYDFTDLARGIVEDGRLIAVQVRNPVTEKGFGGALLAIRYRIVPSIGAELRAGVRRSESVRGLNNDSARLVTVRTAPMTVAGLIRLQRRMITFGAGPAVLLSNYTVVEDHHELYFSSGAWYWTRYGDNVTKRSLAAARGLTGDVTGLVPMSRTTLLEWRVAASVFAKNSTPSTPYFDSVQTSNVQITVALGVMRGWR